MADNATTDPSGLRAAERAVAFGSPAYRPRHPGASPEARAASTMMVLA